MRRGTRGVRGVIAAVAGVLALTACTGEPEEVVRTSGALADGFEIEPGSGLVGAVFPHGVGGHRAVLRVDGDLQRVFEGYVRQAEELGFPVGSEGGGVDAECRGPDDGEDDHIVGEESPAGDPPGEPFPVECTASGLQMTEAMVSSLSVRGLADDVDGEGFVVLTYDRYSGDLSEDQPLASGGPVAAVTDDELAPDLTPYDDDPPLRLVEGSELAAEPLPATCATGGYLAVLRVTDDLMPVMRAYAEQMAATQAFTTQGLVGDDDEPRVWASAAGGGDLMAIGVAGDPSYVLIDRCND